MRRNQKALKVVLAGAMVLMSLVSLPFVMSSNAGAATKPGYNGNIVYDSLLDGNYKIYSVDPETSVKQRLTNNSSDDRRPRVSPKGDRIAFFTNRDGDFDIYTMDMNGDNQLKLVDLPGTDEHSPLWSPDGTKIIFESSEAGQHRINIVDADGTNLRTLRTSLVVPVVWDWSPDGNKLIIYSHHESQYDLYEIDIATGNIVNLTNSGEYENVGWYSPDGTKISYYSMPIFSADIYIMNSDGSNPTRITTTDDYDEMNARWSPDGQKLVMPRGNLDWTEYTLVVMDADGTNETDINLSDDGIHSIYSADWSPDGSKIYFTVINDAYTDVSYYTINLDGTELRLLGNTGFYEGSTIRDIWQTIPNTAPVTTADHLTTPYNAAGIFNILANDTDEEVLSGENLSIAIQPSNGTASIVDGKIRYVPNSDYQGADSLTYQICDSFMLDQLCSTGAVNLTVLAPTPPIVSVVKISGEMYNASTSQYTTSNLRPIFSGTATPGSEIRVEIHSDPIVLTTTADSAGNWSVTPAFDLPSGEHMVYISATLYGLTTEIGAFGLSVQSTLAETGMNAWMMVTSATGVAVAGGALLSSRLKSI